ncbi:MAG: DUF3300 domain-containing protein [Gemmatimonadaceae bacterium]|nr:DUF3300 domain-containing protein [Gemmatimonadaceae bacterium]
MKRFLFATLAAAVAFTPGAALGQEPRLQVVYSQEELDNLVAPVALYPDALLAQVLVAATFPDQVAVASRFVRERGTRDIDDQNWDLSVKAVAHYPPVLNMLANQEDWATALGQAYAAQSGDVMDAVQRLREMARAQGNLVSTREHTVAVERERIVIVPANPRVIYVPTYDPYVVYARPVFGFAHHASYFSFGIGFPIGSWLVYDVDWYGRRVYYDGWYGGGWRVYARPYIHLTPVYVHPRYRSINININIFSRRVNYINLDRRHRYVHRTASWERHDRDWTRYGDRDDRRGPYGRDDDRRPGGRDRDDDRGRGPNDRIGNRVASFDDYRPDRAGNGRDARDDGPVTGSFGTIDRRSAPATPAKGGFDSYGSTRGAQASGRSRDAAPVFSAPPKAERSRSTAAPRIESAKVKPSSGGSARSAPSGGMRAAPSGGARPAAARPSSSAKVKPSGGGGGGSSSRGKARN